MNPNRFPNPLILRALAPAELVDVPLFQLEADFIFDSPSRGRMVIPKGFITDGASIPKSCWSFISPDDPGVLFPSIPHDFCYSTGCCTREQADAVLREGMRACGASVFEVFMVYWGARLFGSKYWRNNTE